MEVQELPKTEVQELPETEGQGLRKREGEELPTTEGEELPNTELVGRSDDPQKCEATLYLNSVEEQRRPLPDYLERIQKDIITPNMREELVNWLLEVAEKECRLVSDTLYLTVSYIDRFLSLHALSLNKLRLLGISSMFIASKYEEITPLRVADCCHITYNIYTKEEVLNMEIDILNILNFEIGYPTTKNFLRIFTRAIQKYSMIRDLKFKFLGCYLAELSLLDYNCVRFLPSMIAASALFLSRFTLQANTHPWSMALQQYTGYTPGELKECVLAIHDLQLCRRGSSLQAVRDKYMQHKFKCVAVLSSPSEIFERYFEAVYDLEIASPSRSEPGDIPSFTTEEEMSSEEEEEEDADEVTFGAPFTLIAMVVPFCWVLRITLHLTFTSTGASFYIDLVVVSFGGPLVFIWGTVFGSS